MSQLTDLRDWARRQARDLERRSDVSVHRIHELNDAGADPSVIDVERDLLRKILADRDLWLDQADAIDRWITHRTAIASSATSDPDPEAAFSDFLFTTTSPTTSLSSSSETGARP